MAMEIVVFFVDDVESGGGGGGGDCLSAFLSREHSDSERGEG